MKRVSSFVLLIAFVASLCVSAETLEAKNWDAFNKSRLEWLINTHGKGGANYDAAKPPYVVFDWDNTCVFLDIEEATLIYQLMNLRFGATPDQLDQAVRRNIDPKINFDAGYNNLSGQAVNIDLLAQDIKASYTWLYQNYSGLGGGGTKTLEKVKTNPHYQNFITKVRYAYDAIGETFSVDVSYPWVLYLFVGLTEAQVRALTVETLQWQLGQKVEKVSWTSPDAATLPNQAAGQVKVSWKNGLRLVPEMQDLFAKLRTAGFDVWVCSASFVDVIREISSNPAFGYANPAANVLAMELERDSQGRIMSIFRYGYDQTQGKGKTATIQRFLAGPLGKYGYDPLFVAGDSDGDQNMLADFPGMKLGLIVNRLKGKGKILGDLCKQAVDSYGKFDAKYLLQGRDDNKGVFTPDQLHIKLGASTGQKLP